MNRTRFVRKFLFTGLLIPAFILLRASGPGLAEEMPALTASQPERTPPTPAAGPESPTKKTRATYQAVRAGTRLQLVAGKSLVLTFSRLIQRVSVGDPKVADVLTISERELLVLAKHPGVTNLIVWDDRKMQSIFDLVAHGDSEGLQEKIEGLYPEERLKIHSFNEAFILAGETLRPDVKKAIGQIAETLAPKKVVNLIQVDAEATQIALRVQIAEISRDALRELGLGFLARDRLGSEPGEIGVFPGGSSFFSPFGNFRNVPPVGPDLTFTGLVNFFIADAQRKLGLFLRALEERGDLKTLAEPRLVTRSGQKASFLAGGEFPVPVPQAGSGTAAVVTIQYKPFGVKLEFTPDLKGQDRIGLKLAPEVSDLDFTNAVSVAGVTVPSLITRRAETEVELKSGQTFAVAGLIQNRARKEVTKIPWMGDIPILGKLFTSERFNRSETELLVLITPEILTSAKADAPMPLPRGAALGRGM